MRRKNISTAICVEFSQLQSVLNVQFMSDVITCINERFAVKNSGILCRTLIFNLNNQKMTILQAKNQSKVARCDNLHFFNN